MNTYLTEKQVAENTGFAVQTLRNMRHEGRGFPYIKISPRAIRYDPEDIKKYLEARKVVPEISSNVNAQI